ncbi:bifunctional phosphopantothenoylcysteine decarboxylase/phosphopantothenate--cysteine ligase CoaBC [Chitinophaga caeni]|uniref:Coenzyme A biosynthesis bifunctional protein CoaBC n=1 Tax=Chitinophaga caeni TaxID=2029983 RepID=A0A291QTM7_9BACT|nr:bifunctional phosphopantothenoylcysteine decarboxylase/phosphopantothenate--cysteine ligase CoaBC [Chitinophaga caeni]ATL47287.1 bifunctional phosphopantothenoylcysteine decarboxylase/phosphopantothenate--cysteine ligase CoaBC [Chitinophaga caeni]
MLQGKKIILAVSGSIAAYKSATLVRLLVKAGAEVKVIMTGAAAQFITPLTMATLSKQEVGLNISENNSWSNHVMLGRWADVMLVAPASANTLAKMAQGICDNLLLAVYLSATCPVMFAPAMDEDMWHHPATAANVEKLRGYGNIQLPVAKGELASGLIGEGRMAEPEEIFQYLINFFIAANARNGALAGKKVLVTAGPTMEPLDPVRFISNHSSGKMGIAIAEALAMQGAQVQLVLGPTKLSTQMPGIEVIPVQTAAQMYDACMAGFNEVNIAVLAAAVADYRPATVAENKIKKTAAVDGLQLEMEKTQDILKTLGGMKKAGQILIGFSLETNNEKEFALKKLKDKNLDLIVLNSLRDEGAGFNHDTNKVTIIRKDGREIDLPLQSKQAVAQEIVSTIIDEQHVA